MLKLHYSTGVRITMRTGHGPEVRQLFQLHQLVVFERLSVTGGSGFLPPLSHARVVGRSVVSPDHSPMAWIQAIDKVSRFVANSQ